MTLEEAIRLIDGALAKLPALRAAMPHSAGHVAFVQTTGLDLARIFGPKSAVCLNFAAIRYQSSGAFFASPLDFKQQYVSHKLGGYLNGLEQAEGVLRSAREQLVQHGMDDVLKGNETRTGGAKVFISHGTESSALTKVERFVRALGLLPIIVVRGASEGMAVDDLVERRMGECQCAIILATGDEDVGGRRQPRPNVLHEIGLAQEKLQNRVVYLKEEGCQFPSNVGPKVWENFTQGNMESAFEKISKELHAFGII
jgi:hypothetical protein